MLLVSIAGGWSRVISGGTSEIGHLVASISTLVLRTLSWLLVSVLLPWVGGGNVRLGGFIVRPWVSWLIVPRGSGVAFRLLRSPATVGGLLGGVIRASTFLRTIAWLSRSLVFGLRERGTSVLRYLVAGISTLILSWLNSLDDSDCESSHCDFSKHERKFIYYKDKEKFENYRFN